ncbi:snoRNA-binding rRNA-processing protein imp4 [Coemansia sp. RSA 2706]|nr:snoRNA-binding rRNA-processing protein imp4 [Coemansia sp. RSA 2711]KAJ1849491.1 snoRNA-binding rRNA-processing protein imp4 [Coemansia sp. RSA 2708]KAJ2300907.1 snoRNA-binding rRNA-processing protein imp4 [Coemansia sp. RSA 2706]KAJ2307082.1 snoRNA-binding rRNA-processing protein imp4 [Coemansia sp. RSA 2705]KAJ2313058.1 snoRNA-binding rRNA-processing protein imp4 [Coemansia sp. RSA 2704]KAJ2362950.1 snoRNA-binding rRNA-processing protein imp4 [Coemansia sp. RSA 2610]KAJ2382284.1 snoRNA-b
MLRRQARLRREYLYKKSLETQERQTFEKKQKLKEALREGRPIPTELQNEAEELNQALKFDEAQTEFESTQDDEYARAGIYDPKVVVTTSRDPSSRLQQFAKEMRLVLPNSQRINRGNYVVSEIVETCKANEVTDLVVVHETRGQPDGLIISHLPYGPTVHFTLYNVVLRHDIKDQGNVSEAYPHLIFEGFGSRLGARVQSVLKYLFPVPKADSKRVMTFANDSDFISFRHHVYAKSAHNEVQLAEVGPRFEMRPYEIRLGTVDMPDADKEWALRTYQRTARKRNVL